MAFALLDHTEEKTTIDEILTGTFREKDRQINFAIEELEKVNAEIQEEIFNSRGYVTYSNALMRCYEIVDNHISKMKGEQE